MKIPSTFAVCASALAAVACSAANASGFDPSNPLHCATQFESYSILAKLQGDEPKSRAFGARAQWYAERARSLPSDQISPEAVNQLAHRIAAAPDGGLALATECFKRQDADPEFQKLTRQK